LKANNSSEKSEGKKSLNNSLKESNNSEKSEERKSKFVNNDDAENESDYAVEIEVHSASSHYSFDEWVEGKVSQKMFKSHKN
jgi:hypothetical protein